MQENIVRSTQWRRREYIQTATAWPVGDGFNEEEFLTALSCVHDVPVDCCSAGTETRSGVRWEGSLPGVVTPIE